MTLRSALDAAGRPLRGTFVLSAAPAVAEMAAVAGFDFVVLDCEHAPLSPYGREVVECVRAAQCGGALALVRVPGGDSAAVGAVLDGGADGVVVAHVDGAPAARAAVAAGHYPPLGSRGAAPVVRGGAYGLRGWREQLAGVPGAVVPLVEDPAGVAAVEAICAVPGVDAVMFGAFDLSVALGRPTDRLGDPEVEAARRRVYAAAAAHGVAVGDYAWDRPAAARMVSEGASWVAVGNDVGMLAAALRAHADPSPERS